MNLRTLGVMGLVGMLWVGAACAADVDIAVSQQETYVGLPLDLVIRIKNARTHDAPSIDPVDGLDIAPAGQSSSSRVVINIDGRRIGDETIEYRFLVTPQRPGEFTIPPIEIHADDARTMTRAVRLNALESVTGDLLFVELESDKQEVFVGQPVQLKLKIFVRPFANPSSGQRFDIRSHLSWFAFSRSNWGAFAEPMQETLAEAERSGRWPGSTLTMHDDLDGQPQPYYLFELTKKLYPDRVGPIELGDVLVIYNYPEQVTRRRSTFDLLMGSGFGSRLSVSKYRPIQAGIDAQSIEVKPVPATGRPSDYQGAVGRYEIAVEATPQAAVVGDPITLRLEIFGDGPMDLVQPPPLAKIPSLTKSFKIADEAMGGVVQGDKKVFVTTIRPIHDAVEQVPAIPFTFFDPETAKYETVYSEPIKIDVDPAEVFSFGEETVQNGSPVSSTSDQQPDESSPEIALDLVARDQGDLLAGKPVLSLLPTSVFWCLLGPPLCWVAFWLVQIVRAVVRRRQTPAMVRRRLNRSQTSDEVLSVLGQFVTKQFRLSRSDQVAGGAVTNFEQVVGQLRRKGHRSEANLCERLLNQTTTQAVHSTETTESLISAAVALVDRLSKNETPSARSTTVSAESAVLWLVAVLAFSNSGAIADDTVSSGPPRRSARPAEITVNEIETILDRAMTAYQSAPSDASDPGSLAEAAAGFEQLVDLGVHNDQVFFLLANAQTRLGDHPQAIANYLRAIRIAPDAPAYRTNLAIANDALAQANETGKHSVASGFVASLGRLTSHVPRQLILVVGLGSWILVWAAVPFQRALPYFPARPVIALGLIGFIFSSGIYLFQSQPLWLDHQAVVVSDPITLRAGDGEMFEVQTRRSGMKGRLVRWTQQRSGWIRVVLQDGSEGWARQSDLEVL